MTKSTYKGSKLKQEQHEKNLGHILYLIKDNYGIHRNQLKKLASKKGPNHMAPLTAERMIDELLKQGRIKLIKSDKSRYYVLDDWYSEVQYQDNFDKIIIETEKIIETLKIKFPALNYMGKHSIISKLEFGFGNIFPIPSYYERILKTSDREEDRCMKMILDYSKNTTKKSVAKLVDDARIKFKEIKTLKKEISKIRKQIIIWDKTPDNPEQYKEQSILLNQLSIKNTSFNKLIQVLYGISSSIQSECEVKFQNY